jgi:hypothetical protein
LSIEKYDSYHEAEDASTSNVAIKIISRSLQAIGESAVMKMGMQEMYFQEERFRKYQFSIENKCCTFQKVKTKAMHLLLLIQKSHHVPRETNRCEL